MRKAIRAIVIEDDKLLVMHRNKFGHEYYTLVGGKIDLGETAEQALMREVSEETGLAIKNPRLVFVEEAGDPYGIQYIYLCDYVSGEPVLSPSSVEAAINAMGQNLYAPMWMPFSQLETIPFLSEELKKNIIESHNSNFPDAPKTIHSTTKMSYTG